MVRSTLITRDIARLSRQVAMVVTVQPTACGIDSGKRVSIFCAFSLLVVSSVLATTRKSYVRFGINQAKTLCSLRNWYKLMVQRFVGVKLLRTARKRDAVLDHVDRLARPYLHV